MHIVCTKSAFHEKKCGKISPEAYFAVSCKLWGKCAWVWPPMHALSWTSMHTHTQALAHSRMQALTSTSKHNQSSCARTHTFVNKFHHTDYSTPPKKNANVDSLTLHTSIHATNSACTHQCTHQNSKNCTHTMSHMCDWVHTHSPSARPVHLVEVFILL